MSQLQTFEGNLDHFDEGNPFLGDDRLPVQFYMGIVPDDKETAEKGHPVFKDVEFIRIFNSKDNIIDRPVRDMDKRRWPGAYQRWKATGDSEPGSSGMKLEFWPQMTRAQAEEFKYFKIYTVEQLAQTPDSTGQKLMNFQRLKALAVAYVEASNNGAPVSKLTAELEDSKSKVAALEDQLAKMNRKLERLSAKDKE